MGDFLIAAHQLVIYSANKESFMTVNTAIKTYPLFNSAYHLLFESVPGSEALNVHLLKEGQKDSFILGLYSVTQSLWIHRDETIHLSHSQLEEILSIAKGIVYAKVNDSSNKNRLLH